LGFFRFPVAVVVNEISILEMERNHAGGFMEKTMTHRGGTSRGDSSSLPPKKKCRHSRKSLDVVAWLVWCRICKQFKTVRP